jgi:CBS domain-containing protein
MVYGDAEQVVRETFADVDVEREDGWTVLFRGKDAVLRVRDEHVQSLEQVEPAASRDTPRRPIRTVRDLMRPAITSVEIGAHLAAAAYLMKQGEDTALVVMNDATERMPIAIITETDIAEAVADGRNLDEVRISDVVTRQPVTVTPDTGVEAAAELMLSSRIRHLPVVEDGRLVGVVDIGDACRGLMQALDDVGG